MKTHIIILCLLGLVLTGCMKEDSPQVYVKPANGIDMVAHIDCPSLPVMTGTVSWYSTYSEILERISKEQEYVIKEGVKSMAGAGTFGCIDVSKNDTPICFFLFHKTPLPNSKIQGIWVSPATLDGYPFEHKITKQEDGEQVKYYITSNSIVQYWRYSTICLPRTRDIILKFNLMI